MLKIISQQFLGTNHSWSIVGCNIARALIELGHKLVFGEIPSLTDWLYTSVFVFGILFFGFYLFNKFENKISERL